MTKKAAPADTTSKDAPVEGAQTPDSSSGDTVELNAEANILELKAENDKLRDQMLRVRAEFENFRRRRNKELEDFRTLANEGLIEDLLPVLDDFKLLLENASGKGDPDSLAKGAHLIETKLTDVLKRRGLEEVAAEGEPFDPDVHEALMQQPSADHEPGTVISVHQHGYTLGGKLLRPSRVIVSTTSDQG